MNEKTYQIGDQTYIQSPIVLGQLRLLMPLLTGLDIQTGSPGELLALLGDERTIQALAVILIEEGSDLREAMSPEALDLRANDLAFAMDAGRALEVAEDFLSVNNGSGVIAKLLTAMTTIRRQMARAVETAMSTASTSSPSSTASPGETSPGATMPSGA